jgi:hypothetical protein
MSRTKITTLDDVKKQEADKLVLDSKQYKKMLDLMKSQGVQISELLEGAEMDTLEKQLLNEQLDTMANIIREFKKKVKDKSISEEIMKETMNIYEDNARQLESAYKTKPNEAYNTKSKEELLQLVIARMKPLNERFDDIVELK